MSDDNFDINLRQDEIARQAVDSLKGYIYQVYQSLSAWLSLEESDILMLEVAEDYAKFAKKAKTLTAVQVKHTQRPSTVTLKTQSITKAIQSFWNIRKANPDKAIRLRYLTTSAIGKERQIQFPNKKPGLQYWRDAAISGTDVEPIRNALKRLKLSNELLKFIQEANDYELREQLIRRIHWDCGAEDISTLDCALKDRLFCICEEKGLLPSESDNILDALKSEILQVIINEDNRYLTRTDLYRTIEKHASIRAPINAVRQMISQTTQFTASDNGKTITSKFPLIQEVSQIPPLSLLLKRSELVERTFSRMASHGALWLYGSSGLGKTTLSRLISMQSKGKWYILELKGLDADTFVFHIRQAIRYLQFNSISGLIIDDFPIRFESIARLQLAILVDTIRRHDGSIIVTSTATPPASLKQICFGSKGILVKKAPYLTKTEVEEQVATAGGDPKVWAGIIYAFSGLGHPQLVAARIIGLKTRGWPKQELLSVIDPQSLPSDDLDKEKEVIRSRLISELDNNERDMLYGLSLLSGNFDRQLAIAVGDAFKLKRPGESFEHLLGPWIEICGQDRFRISPIVSDAGKKTLTPQKVAHIQKTTIEHLLRRESFPGDMLGMFLIHAITTRHTTGLSWLATAVLVAKSDNKKYIARQLFFLTYLLDKKDGMLFPEDPIVSALLRIAQFDIALITEKIDIQQEIVNKFIKETHNLKKSEFSWYIQFAGYSHILMQSNMAIKPNVWLPLISELSLLTHKKIGNKSILSSLESLKNKTGDCDVEQIAFMIRCASLNSIVELVQLFDLLDKMDIKEREHLICGFSKAGFDSEQMISSAWLADHDKGCIDGVKDAKAFKHLAQLAKKWGFEDVAINCECVRSVLLDEYAHDPDSAISVILEAKQSYPSSQKIIEQHAKIYFRRGDYQTARKIFEPIAESYSHDNLSRRAFALRAHGISAAEIGDWNSARDYFCKAEEAASKGGNHMNRISVGLLGERAIVEIRLKNHLDAIMILRRALTKMEKLDPKSSSFNRYCWVTIGQLHVWYFSISSQGHNPCKGIEIEIGNCSNTNPPKDIEKQDIFDLRLYWYMLASIEAFRGVNAGALRELRKRTKKERLVIHELSLNNAIMCQAINISNTKMFLTSLQSYLSTVAYFKKHNMPQDNDLFNPIKARFSLNSAIDWKDADTIAFVKGAIIAFISNSIATSRHKLLDELIENFKRIKGALTELSGLLKRLRNGEPFEGDYQEIAAASLGRLTNANLQPSPEELLKYSIHIWQWLRYSYFSSAVEQQIASELTAGWMHIIRKQRFMLTNPNLGVPALIDVLNGQKEGTKKIASMILAAEPIVQSSIANKSRRDLQNFL